MTIVVSYFSSKHSRALNALAKSLSVKVTDKKVITPDWDEMTDEQFEQLKKGMSGTLPGGKQYEYLKDEF